MKNKTFKNFILVGALVVFALSYGNASAYTTYPYGYDVVSYGYNNNIYSDYTLAPGQINYGYTAPNYNEQIQTAQQKYNYDQQQLVLKSQLAQQQYNYDQQKIIQAKQLENLKNQTITTTTTTAQQPYLNTQSQVQYVAQPTASQIQYLPTQTVNTGSSQGASAYNSLSSATSTNKVAYGNTGYVSNTGKYISYDNNNPMGASAYQYNTAGQIVTTPVVDSNGVAALSIKGSSSFMPSSVFQWIILILIVLAIIVIARTIAKKSQPNEPHAVPVH